VVPRNGKLFTKADFKINMRDRTSPAQPVRLNPSILALT